MALNKKDLEQMYEDLKSQFDDDFAKSILKPTGRSNVFAARDYVVANCIMATAKNYGAPCKDIKNMQDFAKYVPAAVRFRLSGYTPMLAARYDELKEDKQKKLFDSPEWECFVRGTKVRMSDGTYKSIQDIIPGESVVGWDGEGFKSVKVTDSRKSGKEKTYTVTIKNHKVVATEDHEWWTPDGWVQTKNLKEICVQVPSKEQKELLFGHILGDGHVDKYGNIQTSQSLSHKGYLQYLVSNSGISWAELSDNIVDGHPQVRTQTVGLRFKSWRKLFYKGKKKVIPSIISEYMGPAMFASWYMDDGTLMKSNTVNPNARLQVDQFTEKELLPVFDYLRGKGFSFNFLDYGDTKLISFDWKSTRKFCEWISPYVPKAMEYKITCDSVGKSLTGAMVSIPVSVKKTNHGSVNVFCISTETENFVLADGEMVHNCTEKENGCRGWLFFNGGEGFLFSRNYSDVDCSIPDYWENVNQSPKFDEPFGVDVEVKCEADYDLIGSLQDLGLTTDSKLEAMSALLQTYPETAKRIQQEYKEKTGKDLIVFRLIHPLYYKGKNYIKKGIKLKEGKAVYDEVVEYAQAHGLNLRPIMRMSGSRQKKEQFLDTILEAGGEGVVFHNINAEYCTSENRDKDGFVKLKRSVSGSLKSTDGIGDTIDAFVTGFKLGSEGTGNDGLIGALELSIWLIENDGTKKKHVISYVPNIPLELKKKITVVGEDGQISMRPELYNRVVEVDGQAISRVNHRLTHPRLIRFRPDKLADECIMTREFLESQIDTYR